MFGWFISFAVIVPFGAIVVGVFIFELIKSKRNTGPRRGTKPGQGDQIIDHGGHMFGDGGGYPTASRVTRDPQKYAKAFVPSSAKRKKK